MKWAFLALFLLIAGSAILMLHSPGFAMDLRASSSEPKPSAARWYLGAVTTQQTEAQEVGAEFYVPQGLPSVADTYYPLILSAFDSNSSYDQIGILGQFGIWSSTTSTTYTATSGTTYESFVWSQLRPGFYWFNMSISKGVVSFTVAYDNGSVVLSRTARTGGQYFVIAPTFYDASSRQWDAGYSVYEEVDNASQGVPAFNFYSRDNYFVSNGTKLEANWSVYRAGNVPGATQVSLNASAVVIENVATSIGLTSDMPQYYTKEPVQLTAEPVGAIGDVSYTWYLDGAVLATTESPSLATTLDKPGSHSLSVAMQDAAEALTSDDIVLNASKISLVAMSTNGSVSGGGLYDYGNTAVVSLTQTTIPTGSGTRIAFSGWQADSPDGYDGSNSTFATLLRHNITEVADWVDECSVSFRSNPQNLF